ncbi:hypothetical protein I862_00395 [endosymbiont of Acanthamoeba sp. UWC8]|uniref:histidine phosphatase family protein n=1 Tax=endosymbiont of Acanthamoeba sp. UWC8 TaxID=86106 RepID=UPI0004D0DBE0|nr:histidine phosphatase family protein [endosymbiont of Acanthamoeba sp. UWC8]AIF80644.1 hypothetical protein I862_00395 [endosymbiont of Acanthamoeba sp. UWC8]
MQIIETLKYIDKDLPTIFIIRHAERFYKDSPEHDFFCYLTEQGKQQSLLLGKHIKENLGNITKVSSSIVERCIETGAKVIEGNGGNISVNKAEYLTKSFVYDPQNAMIDFPQYTVKELVKMHLAENMISCMRKRDEGIKMLLSPIIQDLLILKNRSIYVTHDYLLGMLYAMLVDLPIDKVEEEWFSYLDGVCLQKTNESKLILYRKESVIDITENLSKFEIKF